MKEQIEKHFSGEDKIEAINLYNKYLLSIQKGIAVFGKNFYTPNIWMWFQKTLNLSEIEFNTNGIFDDSERRMIVFNNKYNQDFPMKLLKIETLSKFTSITHRDFLGAIISLGIDRNRIGDLIVEDNIAYVAVHEEIEPYITYSLEKIKNSLCKIKVCDKSENIPKVQFEEETILIPSLRIDAIISKIARVSRSKAQEMIEEGNVLVDYSKEKNKSRELKGTEKITLRGYGKFRLGNVTGTSKSGKIKIILKKYT